LSLRRSPRRTAAFLAANRRNAKKSTGPRTARGKAQSRLNGLRSGARSELYNGLFYAVATGRPGLFETTAAACVTPEMAAHPLFAGTVQMFREMIFGDPIRSALEWDPDSENEPISVIPAYRRLSSPRFSRWEEAARKKPFQPKPESY